MNTENSLVGKTLEEVEKMGLGYRVMHKDGVAYCGTCDYVPDRYNFSVEKGIIVGMSMG